MFKLKIEFFDSKVEKDWKLLYTANVNNMTVSDLVSATDVCKYMRHYPIIISIEDPEDDENSFIYEITPEMVKTYKTTWYDTHLTLLLIRKIMKFQEVY